VDEAIFADRYPVTLLAGGCACCTGQTDFLTSLRQLCDLRSQQPAADRLRLVVLETSGLADPAAIAGALRIDPLLAFHLALAEVIVLVDARNGAAQLASEPLGRRQIEAADRLVLTKTDLSTPDDVARLIATLKTLNPTAPLGAEVKGEPVPLPDARDAIPLPLADVESGPIAPLQ
ncbi:unnamed protein product, partial [Ectocarpus sp. 12 AP-2014]